MNYIVQYQMYIAKKKKNNLLSLVYILLLDHRIEHRSPIHFLRQLRLQRVNNFKSFPLLYLAWRRVFISITRNKYYYYFLLFFIIISIIRKR